MGSRVPSGFTQGIAFPYLGSSFLQKYQSVHS